MKPLALAFTIMAGLLLLPAVCPAQWLSEVQTESDWESLYNRGYFDYNTYQLYRELAEGAIVADSAAFFRAAMGNPILEITTSADTDSASASPSDTSDARQLRLRARTGRRIEHSGRGSGYVLLTGAGERAAFELKGRQRADLASRSNWEIERRALAWHRGRAAVTLGDYDTDIGLGLAIGRFDFRPVAGTSDTTGDSDDILYPDNSYYNGIKAEYAGGAAFFSAKRYPGLDKRFFGATAATRHKYVTFGVAAAGTALEAAGYDRALGAASLFAADPARGLRAELAYAESGPGVALRLKRHGFDVSAWHYDIGFLNPQCSGPARPDYIRLEDPAFPEAFRLAQAGETGLFARKRLALGRLDLLGATEIWKAAPGKSVAHDNLLAARYPLGDGVEIDARMSAHSGLSNDRVIAELGSSLFRPFPVRARTSIWSESGEIVRGRSFCYIYCSIPIKGRILLGGRLRAYFDGDSDYFLEETLALTDRFHAKATYRWQDSYGGDIGPLYLVMEAAL